MSCFSPGRRYDGAMRFLFSLATVSLFVTSVYAGPVPSNQKDPFAGESLQQRQARKAELRDLEERKERASELQEQREIEHPEMNYDEHEDDLEE